MKFDIYFAIGDSMSIDFYPAQDAEASGITVREDIGAAALFHHNESDMFPEFSGMDLASFFPKIHYKNIAEDGNTCGGFINRLAAMDLSTSPEVCALITLTVGGNDLLSAYRASVGKEKGVLQEEILRIQTEYDHVVSWQRASSTTIDLSCPLCLIQLMELESCRCPRRSIMADYQLNFSTSLMIIFERIRMIQQSQ